MKLWILLYHLFLVLALGKLITVRADRYRRVCYYTNWSQYRHGVGKFVASDIPGHLCSHVIYAFANMEGNQLIAGEWNDEDHDGTPGMYTIFNSLKGYYPDVKTLVAVGGWNFDLKKMTSMLSTRKSRSEFIWSSIEFLRNRTFNGLDFDFEYPAHRGSGAEDRGRFTQLVMEMRSAVEEESRWSGRERLLLSAAVAASKEKIDLAYDVPHLARHLDMINIMTYDFHGSWDNVTGHNSPLFKSKSEKDLEATNNLAYAATYWLQQGAPASKINIGLPLYGRTFSLQDTTNTGLGSPVRSVGNAAPYTGEAGYIAFYEVCEVLKEGASVYWLNDQQVPIAVHKDQWIGFDDANSLKNKVRWIKEQGFGGVMVWSLDLDDFHGNCTSSPHYNTRQQTKFPLLTAIGLELGENVTPKQLSSSVQSNEALGFSRDRSSQNVQEEVSLKEQEAGRNYKINTNNNNRYFSHGGSVHSDDMILQDARELQSNRRKPTISFMNRELIQDYEFNQKIFRNFPRH